ncbi:ABC-F family ATP-binding cassette domain-containing protein [Sutcliffiella horikoshii]|uniref:ABC-F family ATP-binding cassette domain-containing protein n=1 Tax=Sutcliffiella horikoshii TaxID=79883 RepID=A0A5D4SZT5_9BACI|nr:ABC-F family ATP-binding cassette domain-containing protein [Sutcliffiella horikoshii]TYS68489.1 ABC-F family ATP-binding cassette domain-containing protein [Sutcliffiella horikoshii]
MKMLIGEDLSKTYVEKVLLGNASFSIQEKERVGLIGVNGTGKSTLLKIIAGQETPDAGTITASNDYTIGFLSQQPELNESFSVMEQIFSKDSNTNNVIRQYERCLSKIQEEPMNEKLQDQLAKLQAQMDQLQAWDASSNAKAILNKLGITDTSQQISNLSGGQKKRVALSQTLVEAADLLILDEPTNHLDFEAIEWLEDYLSKYQGAVLLVTHDRYFLDKVTNKIFELHNGSIYTYTGNYGDYLEAKAIRQEEEFKVEAKQKSLYRQELEWMRKGAKARTTKQKARIKRFEDLDEKVSSTSSAGELELFTGSARLGKKVMEIEDVSLQFGNKVILKHVNLLIKQKDRIGIVGPNGVGKSTLLNIFAQKISPDHGKLDVGLTVKLGYYTQEQQEMNLEQRMIEYIKEEAEVIKGEDGQHISASQLLERFLFPPHSHGTPIRKLSGGERKRLYLLRILMSQPNVLLLDEPTNDLDTETLTILEGYLEEFPGVVITVSHDRYFLDKVVDELFILEGDGNVKRIFGEYSDYVQEQQLKRKEQKQLEQAKKETQTVTRQKQKTLKLSYQEQKDWDTIEERIMELEEKLETIEKEIATAGSDYEKVSKWLSEQKETNQLLEEAMNRWEELSEKVEKIKEQS